MPRRRSSALARPHVTLHNPNCSFAASDIRSFVHAGSHTTSTFASVTPGTRLDLLRDFDRQRLRRRDSPERSASSSRRRRRGIDDDVVDQPELPDVHRDLGVEDRRDRFDDRAA